MIRVAYDTLRISHLAPPYVLAARFLSISCLMIVVIRETQSCNKASKLSLVAVHVHDDRTKKRSVQ